DSTVYYSVGTSTATLAGDATYFFKTPPVTGVAKATRVWVLGDSGTGTSAATGVRDAYYTFTGTRHTDMVWMLGDNAYNSATDAEYQSNLFNIYPTMLRKSAVWTCVGNHETNQN